MMYCDFDIYFSCVQCHERQITFSIKAQNIFIELSTYHFLKETKATLSCSFSSQTHKHSIQVLTSQDYFVTLHARVLTQLHK